MIDGSGPSLHGLFERHDALGSSLKTSVASSLCRLRAGLSVTWRERGTKSGLFYSEPTTSVRHTDGTGSGLSGDWPTPAAMNPNDGEGLDTWEARRQRVLATKKNGNGFGTPLAIAVQQWPTPSANDGDRGAESRETKDMRGAGGLNLVSAVQWPTPKARDVKGMIQRGTHAPKDALQNMVEHVGPPDPASPSTNGKPPDWSTPSARDEHGHTKRGGKRSDENLLPGQAGVSRTTGSLNPAWVSQLQGFPDGWLDLPEESLVGLMLRSKHGGDATASDSPDTPAVQD